MVRRVTNRKELLSGIDGIIESGAGSLLNNIRFVLKPRVSMWSKLWRKLFR